MEPDEQARRMRAARAQVFGNDERRWMRSVLAAIAEGAESWAG